ncbi:MAG: ABC transporter permease subunit, partial [Lachnospiraceae bacterium]|nr:ABC transporter permease subunit [Lachnospiraceae bacterium]
MKAKETISNTVIYIILIVISVIWLAPFVCIVLQSFRVGKLERDALGNVTGNVINYRGQSGTVVPEVWGLDNYTDLLDTDFVTWYKNTLILAVFCAVVSTFMVLCMSYTLSRFRFRLRKPLMKFMLVLGLFPGILSMIILYRILKDLGLTQANAVPGLMLVYTASSGMGYYISKGFFDTIPMSLDESARIDGANRMQVFFRIILPLSKPIVIYTILTAFLGPWGDFMFAKYVAFGTSKGMNVAVGLASWLSNDQINNRYTMFCAGGVLVAIPVTILF